MARLVYACRFEVPPPKKLQDVLAAYGDWVQRHYRDRRGMLEFTYDLATSTMVPQLPAGHILERSRFVGGKGEVIRLLWAYPVDADPGLEWRNEIRIGDLKDICAVEHTISINSTDYVIMPAHVSLGSPAVIRDLCTESAVKIGDMMIRATAYPMGVKEVKQFLELLQSPMRRVPIVFLSPYANGDSTELDVNAMARRLAGMAVVVDITDAEATWDVAEAVGRTLSCFDGGVRIYWPNFSIEDDPRNHRLYFGTGIRKLGAMIIERAIERSIFAVSAFRFVPDSRLNEIVLEAEQAERQQRLESQKSSSGQDWEEYALELDTELTTANEAINGLQAEIANLKANQHVIFSARAPGETEEEPPSEEEAPPTSVEDACQKAKDSYKNLIVLDSALDGAAKSPFKRPADILAALSDLDSIAADRSGGDILQQLRDRGWGKRSSMHISLTTKARFGASYKFEYNGERQFFEPHITLGSGDASSCASIHFIVDQQQGKVVIGYVGKHLPNTKT